MGYGRVEPQSFGNPDVTTQIYDEEKHNGSSFICNYKMWGIVLSCTGSDWRDTVDRNTDMHTCVGVYMVLKNTNRNANASNCKYIDV